MTRNAFKLLDVPQSRQSGHKRQGRICREHAENCAYPQRDKLQLWRGVQQSPLVNHQREILQESEMVLFATVMSHYLQHSSK